MMQARKRVALVALVLVVLFHVLYCAMGSANKSQTETLLCIIASTAIAVLLGWLILSYCSGYEQHAEHREKYLAAILETQSAWLVHQFPGHDSP